MLKRSLTEDLLNETYQRQVDVALRCERPRALATESTVQLTEEEERELAELMKD